MDPWDGTYPGEGTVTPFYVYITPFFDVAFSWDVAISVFFVFFFLPNILSAKPLKKNLHWGNTLKLSEYVSPEPVRFFERAR